MPLLYFQISPLLTGNALKPSPVSVQGQHGSYHRSKGKTGRKELSTFGGEHCSLRCRKVHVSPIACISMDNVHPQKWTAPPCFRDQESWKVGRGSDQVYGDIYQKISYLYCV